MQDVMEIMGSDLEKIIELSQANLKYLPTASNVQGYGAVGDGGTDDTVSVQAAIDATIAAGGKVVYFPHGTYKVTSLTNTALVVFVGDNAKFSGISDLIYQFGAIPLSFISRQAIINGNFDRWTIGTSFTNPGTQYTADRWANASVLDGGTNPTVIHSQRTLGAGELDGSFYAYRINVNGAGSGYGPNSLQWLSQKIENGTRYLCGAGKKITVTVWVRSDIVGKKFGLWMRQNYGTGGSPSASEVINGTNWTIESTSVLTKHTFTFTTNTLSGKSFGTNNDDSVEIALTYQWGSSLGSRVGASTLETFGGAGNIDIAQVEVNAGDQALPYQPKSINQENIDCLRYRWRSWADGASSPVVGTIGATAFAVNLLITNVRYPVPMRIAPTLQITNNNVLNQVRSSETGAQIAVTLTSISGSNKGFALLSFSGTPFTVGNHYDFDIIADAEL